MSTNAYPYLTAAELEEWASHAYDNFDYLVCLGNESTGFSKPIALCGEPGIAEAIVSSYEDGRLSLGEDQGYLSPRIYDLNPDDDDPYAFPLPPATVDIDELFRYLDDDDEPRFFPSTSLSFAVVAKQDKGLSKVIVLAFVSLERIARVLVEDDLGHTPVATVPFTTDIVVIGDIL